MYSSEEEQIYQETCEALKIVGIDASVKEDKSGYRIVITSDNHRSATVEHITQTIGPIKDLEIILNGELLTE
ncbi:hypothetical protein CL618_02395 [archaeon]|nr:hypothetical protein [archaeon]|tara:strand:- start:204 stop:419 length:216 start_codon:yes stop_codon:yes gene_type:complete